VLQTVFGSSQHSSDWTIWQGIPARARPAVKLSRTNRIVMAKRFKGSCCLDEFTNSTGAGQHSPCPFYTSGSRPYCSGHSHMTALSQRCGSIPAVLQPGTSGQLFYLGLYMTVKIHVTHFKLLEYIT
jgi:hypothetical protein